MRRARLALPILMLSILADLPATVVDHIMLGHILVFGYGTSNLPYRRYQTGRTGEVTTRRVCYT